MTQQTKNIIAALKTGMGVADISTSLKVTRSAVYHVAHVYGLASPKAPHKRPQSRGRVMSGRKLSAEREPWLRVSTPVLRFLGWKPRDQVTVKAENGRIVIEREIDANN